MYFSRITEPFKSIFLECSGTLQIQSLTSFFSPACPKAIFENFAIYSNKFFHNFTGPNPVLLLPGFGKVG
jgi:hypothetical protein